MFDKIFEKLNDYDRFKSNSKQLQFIENLYKYVFFNDDEECMRKEVDKIKNKVNTEEEVRKLFHKKYKFPPILNTIVDKYSKVSNITGVIDVQAYLSSDVIKEEVTNYSDKQKEILKRYAEFYYSKSEEIIKVTSYQLEIPFKNFNEKYLKTKLFFTSKQAISDEFGVNKRTFNKWLVIVGLGGKYKGKKRICFDEYIEIFTALFLSKSEKLDLNNNLETYRKRIDKSMKFSKSDIANLSSSDLKTQKDNLRKIEKYNLGNIFSYSITKLFVDKMGTQIDF